MPTFKVDAEKCRRDGICSRVCPANIIGNDENGLPYLIEAKAHFCIGCGQCVSFCPHGASSLDGLPMRAVRKINRALLPSPEAMAELLQSRRSIRVFSDKKVPREVTERIAALAASAPTAKNQRKIRWVMLENPQNIRRIVELVGEGMNALAGDNPTTPPQRMARALAMQVQKGQDPILRGAGQVAVAVVQNDEWGVIDGAIALSYFEIAAHSLGVGCCWGGYVTSAAVRSPEIRKLLGVGPDEMVGGVQMFGYPGIKASYTPPRELYPIDWK